MYVWVTHSNVYTEKQKGMRGGRATEKAKETEKSAKRQRCVYSSEL